jgi:hypothetical protein
MAEPDQPQQPTHRAYSVIKREEQDGYWLNLGLVFPHKDGRGSISCSKPSSSTARLSAASPPATTSLSNSRPARNAMTGSRPAGADRWSARPPNKPADTPQDHAFSAPQKSVSITSAYAS